MSNFGSASFFEGSGAPPTVQLNVITNAIAAAIPAGSGMLLGATATPGLAIPITLGTNLSLSGNTLNAVGGGGAAGVTTFNSRTGDVSLSTSDVTTALGYTPYSSTNPSGFQTASQVSSAISAATYSLPTASTSTLGGVKVDGSSITISGGVISASTSYTLPTASTTVLGGVKVDGSTITISGGVISANAGGSSGVSSFNTRTGTVTLTTSDVTGVLGSGLPVANGGTGATTAFAARTALGVSTVGNTGAYSDLTGKPTIPTAVSALTNDSGYQTASQVTTAIAAGTAANVSGTVAVATGGTGGTTAAAARANLALDKVAWGVDFSQGVVVANGTITVVRKAPFAMTINSLDYEVGSAAGSFTVAVQIAGTPVTGLSAVAVSSATSANAVASGANTVTAGQQITIVISSVSGSPTGANLQINATR